MWVCPSNPALLYKPAMDSARVRLGRIRCLVDAVERMKRGAALPEALCFVPKEVHFEFDGKEALEVLEEAGTGSKVVDKLPEGKTTRFVCEGRPLFNEDGGWMRTSSPHAGWLLLQPKQKAMSGKVKLVVGKDPSDWLKCVERMCTLQIVKQPQLSNVDKEAVELLQTPPPGWNMEADDELAQFLVEFVGNTKESIAGGVPGGEHFTKVEASSEEDQISDLLESDMEDHYWESDGDQGNHWLRFHMKPGVVVEKFSIFVDPDDSSYLPRRVVVKAGSRGNMSVITTRNFGSSDYDKKELQLLLMPMPSYKELIEVHIKSCFQGGIDTRVRAISVTTRNFESLFLDSELLSEDVFTPEKISRYPKLQPFTSKQLFQRGLVLKRLAYLLNTDLTYLLPRPKLTAGVLESVGSIRQLWPLSAKRNVVIQELLSASTSNSPSRPTVYINRMAAKEHRDDPSKDPECKSTNFNQLFRELKKHTKPSSFNYRWAGHWSQWWECKFMQEGIIDQGGGFRDSLSDIAEELCPSEPNAYSVLPFFIRSPNQSQDSSNVYRDAYIPNPTCVQPAKFQFIGQLMGAMFRSQESLVLSLPQVVWKQLLGDTISWARDFISVDSAEVKFIDSIEGMDRDTFESSFAGVLNYTTVLSNGETVPLIPNSEKLVTYEERFEYCKLVKKRRMEENSAAIAAIREGLTKVIPADVLSLLTWQELELKVCGLPEITVEALKKSTRYDSALSESNARVKTMWAALEQFSNEDRSRFLRFITGRRRLPCTVYIDSSEENSKLPQSATCSNTLYLPKYSSVEEAVEKLKYAAYNCVAIDTDMTASPWES